MTKIVFIEPTVEKQDILKSSFKEDVVVKVQSTFDTEEFTTYDDITHVSFLYHEQPLFPFCTKRCMELKELTSEYEKKQEEYNREHERVYDDQSLNEFEHPEITSDEYRMYLKEYKENVNPRDPTYFTKGFTDELRMFKENHPNIIVDILTCNIRRKQQKDITAFHRKTNVTVRFSTDVTGNEPLGDWHMEYTLENGQEIKDIADEDINNNVKATYFTNLIQDWDVTLNVDYAFTLVGVSFVEGDGDAINRDHYVTLRGFKVTCIPDIFSYDKVNNVLKLETDIDMTKTYPIKFYDAWNSTYDNPTYVAYTTNYVYHSTTQGIYSVNVGNITERTIQFKLTSSDSVTYMPFSIWFGSFALTTLDTGIASFDGNNHTITAKDFTMDPNYEDTTGVTPFFVRDEGVMKNRDKYIKNVISINHPNNNPNVRHAGAPTGQLTMGSRKKFHISNVHITMGVNRNNYLGSGFVGEYCSYCYFTNCTLTTPKLTVDYQGGFTGRNPSNMEFTGCTFTGNVEARYISGMVGYAALNSSFVECHMIGNVYSSYSGGTIGYNIGNCTVTNCTFRGDVGKVGFSSEHAYSGGVIGPYTKDSTVITGCKAYGNIYSNSGGGVQGSNLRLGSSIKQSSFEGNLFGERSGGVVGANANEVSVEECYMKGDIYGTMCGGIVSRGFNGLKNSTNNILKNCFFIGTVHQTAIQSGGIAASGVNWTTITGCYAEIDMHGYECGGITGESSSYNTITNCFVNGYFRDKFQGGICGVRCNNTTIENCYSGCDWNNVNYVDGFTSGDIWNFGTGGISSGYATQTIRNCYSRLTMRPPSGQTVSDPERQGAIVMGSTGTYTLSNNYYGYDETKSNNLFQLRDADLANTGMGAYTSDNSSNYVGYLSELPLLTHFRDEAVGIWEPTTYQNYNATPILKSSVVNGDLTITKDMNLIDADLSIFSSQPYDFSGTKIDFAQNVPAYLLSSDKKCLQYVSNITRPTSTGVKDGENIKIEFLSLNQDINDSIGAELNSIYGLTKGQYILNVPSNYPITILNVTDADGVSLTVDDDEANTTTGSIGLDIRQYTFYFGKVYMNVSNDFGIASFYVKDVGFMFTQNKLFYDFECEAFYKKSKILYKTSKVFLPKRITIVKSGSPVTYSDSGGVTGNYNNYEFTQDVFAASNGEILEFKITTPFQVENNYDFLAVHVSDDGDTWTCLNDSTNFDLPKSRVPETIRTIDSINGSTYHYIFKHTYDVSFTVPTNKQFVMFTFHSDEIVPLAGWNITLYARYSPTQVDDSFKIMDKLQTDLILNRFMFIMKKLYDQSDEIQRMILDILLDERVFYSVEFQYGKAYSLIDIVLGREMTEFRSAGYSEYDLVRATFSSLSKRETYYAYPIIRIFESTYYIDGGINLAASDLTISQRNTEITKTLNSLNKISLNHAFGHPDISYSEDRVKDIHTEETTSNPKSSVYKLFEILRSSSDKRKHALYNYVNSNDTVRMPMIYKLIEPVNTMDDYIKYRVSLIRDKTFKNKGLYNDAVKYDDMYLNPIFTKGYKQMIDSYTNQSSY